VLYPSHQGLQAAFKAAMLKGGVDSVAFNFSFCAEASGGGSVGGGDKEVAAPLLFENAYKREMREKVRWRSLALLPSAQCNVP
jgi:hypothetical protein